MKLIFAKSKKAGVSCACISAIFLIVFIFACYYLIGNIICGIDSPFLISESHYAFFIGYYLIAAGYAALAVLSLLISSLLLVNTLKAFKNK